VNVNVLPKTGFDFAQPSAPLRLTISQFRRLRELGVNVTKDFGPFLTLGLQLAISVVVFFFIGYWLDGKFGMALGKQADADLKQAAKNKKEEKLHH
jgi:hypothetical protein